MKKTPAYGALCLAIPESRGYRDQWGTLRDGVWIKDFFIYDYDQAIAGAFQPFDNWPVPSPVVFSHCTAFTHQRANILLVGVLREVTEKYLEIEITKTVEKAMMLARGA